MQKITKENIQDYALKLMFKMKDEEFEAFEKEFETILKQMDLIGQIEGIENVEPLVFPFKLKDVKLREDIATSTLTTEDAVKNAKETIYDEVKVPKVVGGGEA
jgi:aspartyl/glutamyl-tRNA(Asn/Gln) amidotransferase C subunit